MEHIARGLGHGSGATSSRTGFPQTVLLGGAGGKHWASGTAGVRLTTLVAFMYPSSNMKSTATRSPIHGRRLGKYLVRQPTLTSAHWLPDLSVIERQPLSRTVPLKVQILYALAGGTMRNWKIRVAIKTATQAENKDLPDIRDLLTWGSVIWLLNRAAAGQARWSDCIKWFEHSMLNVKSQVNYQTMNVTWYSFTTYIQLLPNSHCLSTQSHYDINIRDWD